MLQCKPMLGKSCVWVVHELLSRLICRVEFFVLVVSENTVYSQCQVYTLQLLSLSELAFILIHVSSVTELFLVFYFFFLCVLCLMLHNNSKL